MKIIVDLDVIRKNLIRIKTLTGGKLLFMVKADAYGHGMCRVASACERSVDMFGVATVDEGAALRDCGVKKDVLVAVCPPEEMQRAASLGLTVAIADCRGLGALVALSKTSAARIRFQLKLDTGMHRLGFEEDELECVLKTLKDNALVPDGVYSHLRDVDENQISAYGRMSAKVKKVYPEALRHLASSHSVYRQDIGYDMARVGLYGYKNAMTVVSEVLAVRRVNAGEHVCYGDYTFDKPTNIAIVFGGYADGIRRENPSPVMIRGNLCRVVGNVCMDMFAVDCKDFSPRVGEAVVLLGEGLLADGVANERKTIEYTVLTGWRGRAERIYFDDESAGQSGCKS